MLRLETPIGHGAMRQCWLHPDDPDKCVKTPLTPKALFQCRREIMLTQLLLPVFGDRIAGCEPTLIETDHGPAMVCELIRNADGTPAPSLRSYLASGGDPRNLLPTLDPIMRTCIENDLLFYDFNHSNFVIRTMADGSLRVIFVDLKSLHTNGYWGFLKMERYIAPLGRNIMYRRMKRFYTRLGLEFPFDALCREKYLRPPFLVAFRPSLKKWERAQRKNAHDIS